MGDRLKNPPVYFTIAAIQHNRLAAIADYMPKVQDAFRKEGWTGYDVVQPTKIEFAMGEQKIVGEGEPQWMVYNTERTAAYIFGHEVFAFQTTDYHDKDKFFEDFRRGLDILHKVVGLAETRRVGMRMLDAIRPKKGEAISDYVHSSLLSFPEALAGSELTPLKGYIEHEFSGPDCLVVTRLVRLNGALALPVDLASVPFTLPARIDASIEGPYSVLDVDSGTLPGTVRPFREQDVMEELKLHKKNLTTVFAMTTTAHARASWN